MRKLIRKALALLPKVGRLLTFIAVVYGIAMFFAVGRAEAEIEDMLLSVGADMMHHPTADEGALRSLHLNGALVQLRTAHINAPLDEVLDYFEARCRTRDGRFAEQLAALNGELPAGLGAEELSPESSDGTTRLDLGNKGYVACLDMGEEIVDPEMLGSRVLRFLDSGDMSDVGHMRYLYGERVDENHTFYVTMMSDSELNLFEMFPSEGDVPGVDPVPRPEHSRRILSSYEDGKPYGLTIYSSEGTPEQVAQGFERSMGEEGWSPVEHRPGERVRIEGAVILTFSQGERLTTISIYDQDGQTVSTVAMADE